MTSVRTTHDSDRLQFRPFTPTTGYVDGGWWPRSRDLVAELPALLPALEELMGPVETVTFNLTAWEPAERRITLDGKLVRLAGYHSQNPATIDAVGFRNRVTLLVVPPDTEPGTARAVLAAAADGTNLDAVDVLLAGGTVGAGATSER